MNISSHVLKLECIGDDRNCLFRAFGFKPYGQPWVARIRGFDPTYGFEREFLHGKKDYSQGNSVGSRGVYLYFFLDKEGVYEVFERLTWKRSRRYFAHLSGTDFREIEKDQVLELCSAPK